VTSEFKAQNESGYCGEVRHETGCDKPVTLCIHRLDRCVFCADYIDERTNESERKPYFSHSAMKDVGEGKCENGHKKYSQALGSTNLICSKGHVVFLHFTPTTRIWAYANARTHARTHTATSHSFRLKNFTFTQKWTVGYELNVTVTGKKQSAQ